MAGEIEIPGGAEEVGERRADEEVEGVEGREAEAADEGQAEEAPVAEQPAEAVGEG